MATSGGAVTDVTRKRLSALIASRLTSLTSTLLRRCGGGRCVLLWRPFWL
eukprot:COSAG01_NODE_50788_length_360_cov_0.961686_1_plen_49_part_10